MKYVLFLCFLIFSSINQAANIAYIHGDVAEDGTTPSGTQSPYDQMLLDDTGSTGLSMFKSMIEAQGHTITQYYDAQTALTANFLDGFSVVIFGLHQKSWSATEKVALDDWLKAGGGMLIYSDSASGGKYNNPNVAGGAQNTVGQTATNNLIAQYGMQVTVDQANGVKQAPVVATSPNISLAGLVLEGEGVSPVAVSDNPDIEVLIPFTENVSKDQNITISNPTYSALALCTVESGHIAVMFDRQPMWNNGPGSDIEEQDNEEILRRLINFLAQAASTPTPTTPSTPNADEVNLVPIILLLE